MEYSKSKKPYHIVQLKRFDLRKLTFLPPTPTENRPTKWNKIDFYLRKLTFKGIDAIKFMQAEPDKELIK